MEGQEQVGSRETVELQQRLTSSRPPLPAQRWGFLPTRPFWNLAALTPVSFAFWFPAVVFYDWLRTLGLPWWQNGLGCMVVMAVWAGLVERWSRRYFVRRYRCVLRSSDVPSEAPGSLAPASDPQRKPPIVATAEFWDYAFARLFGWAKGIAAMLFEFVFFMSAFYPSWRVVLGAFLVVAAMSLALGWWQRRLLRSHLEGAGAGKALAGGAMAVSSGRGPSEGLTAADRS